jgi:CelD/BcsL family acetyltransferase involved in cellulose biosynthesis
MKSKYYEIAEGLSIKVVSTYEEFVSLRETWNGLADKQSSYFPWLSWDWFNLNIKYFMEESRLLILLIYKDHCVVAIAPFLKKHQKYKGLFKTRMIELIGNVHSPIQNFIFGGMNKDARLMIVENVFNFFRNVYSDWDVIELRMIPEENDYFRMIVDVITGIGLTHRSYFHKGNWYLDEINYPFSEYFQNLNRKHRKDIKRCQQHLQSMGNLTFYVKKDANNLGHYFDLYDEVRARSWKADEKNKEFLRDFTEWAAQKGWLRLAYLFLNDDAIAYEKWFVYKNTALAWAGAYDAAFEKYSPGKIACAEILKYMIDSDRISEIDHGVGDEDYKQRWTPKRRERKGITVFNDTARGHILKVLMTKVLPAIEQQPFLLSAKNRISAHLKRNYDKV